MIHNLAFIFFVLCQCAMFFSLGVVFSLTRHTRKATDGWKDTLNEWEKSNIHYKNMLVHLDQQHHLNFAKIIAKSHFTTDIRVLRRMLKEEFLKSTGEEAKIDPALIHEESHGHKS